MDQQQPIWWGKSDQQSQTRQVPDKRPTKIPQTRNSQFNKTETDGKDEHTRSRKTENTANVIKKAEKDSALDLPLLVDERVRDIKSLNAITAIEMQQLENIFYPYRRTDCTSPQGTDCYFTTIKL